jgi:2-phosphoglycerate kinase
MAGSKKEGDQVAKNRKDPRGRRDKRVMVVEQSGISRPYMRGIMVHSLMARGVDFEDAYATAHAVGERIRQRREVPRAELSKMVDELLGSGYEHQPPIPIPLTLDVIAGKRRSPFSKGTLSQSLLAASLEPDDAFDVARVIEAALLQEGRLEIRRDELRKRAYARLLERFGRKAAERYLVWREYEVSEKPVIVMLGGTTGVGKTSIALEVARRLGISRVLSTDSIRQVMRIMLSQELMPALHASSFEAHREIQAPGDEGQDDLVVDGFLAQTSAVSVGVRAAIDRAIEESTSLVLDGVSLVPGLIDLDEYKDRAHVFFLLVARLDTEAFESNFAARAEQQHHRNAERYMQRMSEILTIQDYLLDLAERYDVPIVDSITLEGSVLLVIRHVVESLRKGGHHDISQLL